MIPTCHVNLIIRINQLDQTYYLWKRQYNLVTLKEWIMQLTLPHYLDYQCHSETLVQHYLCCGKLAIHIVLVLLHMSLLEWIKLSQTTKFHTKNLLKKFSWHATVANERLKHLFLLSMWEDIMSWCSVTTLCWVAVLLGVGTWKLTWMTRTGHFTNGILSMFCITAIEDHVQRQNLQNRFIMDLNARTLPCRCQTSKCASQNTWLLSPRVLDYVRQQLLDETDGLQGPR